MEDGRDGKEADGEACKIDGHVIVVQPVLVATNVARVVVTQVSRIGAIVPRRPDRHVVHVHLHRGDLRDAKDAHLHVLRVVPHGQAPAPVGHVQRDKDHGGVREEADQIGPPDCAGARVR